jgi:AcrR family transcriptional regulator
MLAAAEHLFIEQGYGRTTIAEIATAAGVAEQTVYWAFGSKRAILTELRNAWLAEARTGERLAEVLGVATPRDRLWAFASFMTHQWATGARVIAIHRDAMRVDAAVVAEVEEVLEQRAAALRAVVAPLGPAMRTGVTVDAAHDILLALSLDDVYRAFLARSWTDAQYQAWLGDALCLQLLTAGGEITAGEATPRP